MIQQAQLDFANKNSNVFIISTNNVDHNMDECHYDYKFGYRILAEYAAQQILHYQYQETNSYGIRSLLPKRLKRLNDFKIEIELDNPDLIFIDENCASDFYLNSSGEFPDKIYLENHSLILLFKNFVPLDYHLSYSGHSGLKFPSIQDSEGHGLVSFYNLSDTDLNWNFEYVNTIAPEMPIAENTHFSFDSIPIIPPANGTNDGFYFYTAYNELIVESNKFEDCMLTIAYFNPLGEYIKTKKVKILNGKNRINLSIEKGKIYYLSLQAKGDKFVAYKKMKISY